MVTEASGLTQRDLPVQYLQMVKLQGAQLPRTLEPLKRALCGASRTVPKFAALPKPGITQWLGFHAEGFQHLCDPLLGESC